ncbi:cytochrome c oxidase assembly factor 6 homolog isoform X2 [Bicyclus anynana]|uniref:Cytochrome c oxidase assembly factor 6 homolog isoform X2 n=1 Tax=Bicyclus anynana TaxID=110368 RepID=A0ABM3LSS5_BICAN|nr:cytochrome c oxidase assembly factor 6 homolog isoform X2 [Bicyclus anynana]
MSFPDKQQRKTCWDSRDRYWECLDDENIKDSSLKPKVCAELRRIFEKSCPAKWVTHFDRKRDYDLFKQKMQKEGFEPIKDSGS